MATGADEGTETASRPRVLGIVGSPTNPSKTRAAVEAALDALGAAGAETPLLHLAEYHLDRADGRGINEYRGDTAAALEAITEADAYIVGSPVYRGSVSGSLKNLLDMVPRGQWQGDVAPFENAAVGLVATGATPHHALAIDQELRPIFGFFGAHTVGGSVYATEEAFEDGSLVDEVIERRLERLGTATLELHEAIETGEALGELGPQY